jgi:hypothetical protein
MNMRSLRTFAAGLLAGGLLMAAIPAVASSVQQYVLTKAAYPIVVNGSELNNPELPVLNYEGNTYIPMRAVGEVLGAEVSWNEALKRAEIRYGEGTPAQQNTAFRKVKVMGEGGVYTVTGEARVFEAVMQYAVSDGHNYLIENFHTLSEGAPAWSAFTLKLSVPQEKLPENGTLTLELFEYSAKDGSIVNILFVPLESFR